MTKTWIQAVVIALITAVVLTGVHQITAPTIERVQQQQRNEQLAKAVPPGHIDGQLQTARQTLPIEALNTEATVYWGTRKGELSAVLLDFVTPNGYSGDIRLLVALEPGGQVLGVRVLAHRETAGLGDGIERAKSDWIKQFEGTDLDSPPMDEWAADRRGGAFDTLSAATITSQAVIQAVQSALISYRAQASDDWLASIQTAPES